MGFPEYRRDLEAPDFDANRMLDRYFHCGQSVAFRDSDPNEEPFFKSRLARGLEECLGVAIHPLQLILCGSAHLGFSPVPEKLGKSFNSTSSDIDVAVVSSELFDRWWLELQSCDLVGAVRTKIAEDLFWGFINPWKLKEVSVLGRSWLEFFRTLETDRAKGVRGRLYRNLWSMQNYHRLAIIKARESRLMMRQVR